MRPVYVQGISPGTADDDFASQVREVILKATDDLSWLQEGDQVLLKPALNSGDPYPATTHPQTLAVTSQLLTERGATVIIGDQSGIEYVLAHPGGVLRGSSRANYAHAGMGSADDNRFVSFEEKDWDQGFIHYQSEKTSSWKNGFFITSMIDQVDHMISLPRVSSHTQAGVTLGMKIMVGLLREDSRLEFHANGPFNKAIVDHSSGSNLPSHDDHSDTFFEKIVEISDAIKEKLRLTLFTATKVQVTFGPDAFSFRKGDLKLGEADVITPNPGLVFGSVDQVAAEAFALALLMDLKRSAPLYRQEYERLMLIENKYIQDLYTIQVKQHPFISHAIQIGLGQMPGEIVYQDVPQGVQDRLNQYIQ